MKKTITIFSITLIFLANFAFAQSFKEFKAGNVFYINLPDYMTKTTGLNSSSTIQYKSTVKDVYGFVIEDSKEELKAVELNYGSINEFYDNFITKFLIDQEKRKVSKPIMKKIGNNNYMETDVSYFDKDANTEIYYLAGIVETPTYFYKVLSWTTLENKDKFKADFQKILFSLKD